MKTILTRFSDDKGTFGRYLPKLLVVIAMLTTNIALGACTDANVEFTVSAILGGTASASLAGSTISISNSDPCNGSAAASGTVTGRVSLVSNTGYGFTVSWAGCSTPTWTLTCLNLACYSLVTSNFVTTGTSTNGTISFDVRVVTARQIVFSADPLEAVEGTMCYASLDNPDGWGPTINWSIIGDALGCTISNSLNGLDGIIVASTNNGSILVRASGTNGCCVDRTLTLARCDDAAGGSCGGASCSTTPGNSNPSLENGVNFGINVGQGNQITILGNIIDLFTPSALHFDSADKLAIIVTNADGTIGQIKTADVLTVVNTLSTNSYEILI